MTSNGSPVPPTAESAAEPSSNQQSMRNRKRKAPVKRASTIQFQPSEPPAPLPKRVSANDDVPSNDSDGVPKQPARNRLRKIVVESDDEGDNKATNEALGDEDINQSVADDKRKKKRKKEKAKLRSELPLSSQRRQLSNAERFARFLGM